MKNIDLFIVLSLCLPFVGCVTANSIKPSDVKAYKTPNHLIAAKSLYCRLANQALNRPSIGI